MLFHNVQIFQKTEQSSASHLYLLALLALLPLLEFSWSSRCQWIWRHSRSRQRCLWQTTMPVTNQKSPSCPACPEGIETYTPNTFSSQADWLRLMVHKDAGESHSWVWVDLLCGNPKSKWIWFKLSALNVSQHKKPTQPNPPVCFVRFKHLSRIFKKHFDHAVCSYQYYQYFTLLFPHLPCTNSHKYIYIYLYIKEREREKDALPPKKSGCCLQLQVELQNLENS